MEELTVVLWDQFEGDITMFGAVKCQVINAPTDTYLDVYKTNIKVFHPKHLRSTAWDYVHQLGLDHRNLQLESVNMVDRIILRLV